MPTGGATFGVITARSTSRSSWSVCSPGATEDASFHDEAFPDSPSNLDPDFLRGVWKMRAETSSVLLFWTLCKHVLQHALFQLDRQHAGMSMTVVQCMPPAQDGTIKSRREVFGRGTPPC